MALWEGSTSFVHPYVGMLHKKAGCSKNVTAETTFKYAFSTLFRFSKRVHERSNEIANVLGLTNKVSAKILPFVGVHARIGGGEWNDPLRHRLDQLNEFLDCANSKRRLVRTSMQALSQERTFDPGEIPIVIFSDSAEFKLAAVAADAHVKTFNSSLIHIDKSSSSDKVRQGNVDSFAEIYLLSQALCIVGSSSTFSGVAGALQREEGFCFTQFSSCHEGHLDYFHEDEKHKLESFRSLPVQD